MSHYLWCGLSRQTTEYFDLLTRCIYYFCISKVLSVFFGVVFCGCRRGPGVVLCGCRSGPGVVLCSCGRGLGAELRTRPHLRSRLGQPLCCSALVSCQLTHSPVQAGLRSWDIIFFLFCFLYLNLRASASL